MLMLSGGSNGLPVELAWYVPKSKRQETKAFPACIGVQHRSRRGTSVVAVKNLIGHYLKSARCPVVTYSHFFLRFISSLNEHSVRQEQRLREQMLRDAG